ncbi:Signal transducer and activator of transcription 2, partial [Galemys pyrenaicus]
YPLWLLLKLKTDSSCKKLNELDKGDRGRYYSLQSVCGETSSCISQTSTDLILKIESRFTKWTRLLVRLQKDSESLTMVLWPFHSIGIQDSSSIKTSGRVKLGFNLEFRLSGFGRAMFSGCGKKSDTGLLVITEKLHIISFMIHNSFHSLKQELKTPSFSVSACSIQIPRISSFFLASPEIPGACWALLSVGSSLALAEASTQGIRGRTLHLRAHCCPELTLLKLPFWMWLDKFLHRYNRYMSTSRIAGIVDDTFGCYCRKKFNLQECGKYLKYSLIVLSDRWISYNHHQSLSWSKN